VSALLSYGYPLDHVMGALEASGGSLLQSLASLFTALFPAAGGADGTSESGGGSAADAAAACVAAFAAAGPSTARGARPEAWGEEREVLEAIYGRDVAYPQPGCAVVTLDWPEAKDKVELHVWCPPLMPVAAAAAAPSYPDVPPAVAVTCAKLPPAARLVLTKKLADEAVRLAGGGHMAVHDLAVAVSEALEEDGEALLTMGGRSGRTKAPAPYDRPLGAADAADGGKQGVGDAAAAAAQQAGEGAGAAAGAGRVIGAPRPRRQQGRSLVQSPEVMAAESARLLQEHKRLQVSAFCPGWRVWTWVCWVGCGRCVGVWVGGEGGGWGVGHLEHSHSSGCGACHHRHTFILIPTQPFPPFPPHPLAPPPPRHAQSDPSHASMRATRASLPAAAQRDELLSSTRGSDVLVISGATGCGKSTQVRLTLGVGVGWDEDSYLGQPCARQGVRALALNTYHSYAVCMCAERSM